MNKPSIAIIGAGGHCKVIIDLINEMDKYDIVGVYDDYKQWAVSGVPIIGTIDKINENIDRFIIAIGNDAIREKIAKERPNLNWATLIHPRSIVSKSAKIKSGSIICAGAVVQPEVIIGNHCIVNTNCNIDHESIIDDFSSICPGVTICGCVTIGQRTFIGANATIIQNIKIGQHCVIGAGSVIIRNIDDNCKVVGNPGRLIKNHGIL